MSAIIKELTTNPKEYEHMLGIPEAAHALQDIGVDPRLTAINRANRAQNAV